MLVVPAAKAQQVDTPKQSLSARIKQKYLERRAKFMHRVKDAYFAVGCKVLAREAGIQALTSADSYLAFVGDQTIVDLKDDEALRLAAMKKGLDRAEKPGECIIIGGIPKLLRQSGEPRRKWKKVNADVAFQNQAIG